MSAPALAVADRPTLRIRGTRYPLLLPTLRDPRLHLAAVIVSLQVLGQTVLGFELSIAQILVSILTCAGIEVALTFWRRRGLMWPASALLTGNGVAFILRGPGTGLLAASGHCMTARWHVGQVCGGSFWSVLALSPEILVFMFFMITDPRTTPAGRVARAVYGASVAFLATLLVAPARTEFSTKVGGLAGLVVVCAARPVVERLLAARGGRLRVPAPAAAV